MQNPTSRTFAYISGPLFDYDTFETVLQTYFPFIEEVFAEVPVRDDFNSGGRGINSRT